MCCGVFYRLPKVGNDESRGLSCVCVLGVSYVFFQIYGQMISYSSEYIGFDFIGDGCVLRDLVI